jgi:hypothetical protein
MSRASPQSIAGRFRYTENICRRPLSLSMRQTARPPRVLTLAAAVAVIVVVDSGCWGDTHQPSVQRLLENVTDHLMRHVSPPNRPAQTIEVTFSQKGHPWVAYRAVGPTRSMSAWIKHRGGDGVVMSSIEPFPSEDSAGLVQSLREVDDHGG